MVSEVVAPPVRPRNPGIRFDESIPRHWFGGSGLLTQLANGVNLLFPEGERFFVRSVRYYMDQFADDPELFERVRGFCAQEGRHAKTHEDYFQLMRAQGYEIDRFLATYRRLAYDFLERISPPALRLSATVALEHFTAIMADNCLRERLLDHAHPTMARLLYWHAAEEIEHKAVAFDVLERVNPSYALRMAGLALATVTLGGFWIAGTRMLLAQDRAAGRDTGLGPMRAEARERSIFRRVFLRGIREYLRPGFHPAQNDNYHRAHEYLTSVGLA